MKESRTSRGGQPITNWPLLSKHNHARIDARNLAMCRLIAGKIRRQPNLYQRAVDTLERWKRLQDAPHPALLEWERIMRRHAPADVLGLLTEESERGNRLRQSDPFCDILSRDERRRILRAYEEG